MGKPEGSLQEEAVVWMSGRDFSGRDMWRGGSLNG